MELRVETADGCALPNGCYVGVRVGDVLKQGRYEPQRCYHFPAMERRRNAKIDVYQHVGTCVVAVDPGTKSMHEVTVTSTEPSFPATRLKVCVQSKSEEVSKQQREERTNALKNQAKDYLTKHSIEERLSEAVKALLKEQPDDPTEFLCRQLRGNVLPPVASKGTPVIPASPTKSAAPPAPEKPKEEPKPVPTVAAPKPEEPKPAVTQKAAEPSSAPARKQEQPVSLAGLKIESPPYLMSTMSVLGPAFSSMGLQPSLLFI